MQPRTARERGEGGRAVRQPGEKGDDSAKVSPTDLEGCRRRVSESLAGCRGCLGLVEAAPLQVQVAGAGEETLIDYLLGANGYYGLPDEKEVE